MSPPIPARDEKREVQDFWNAGSCGEAYAQGETFRQQLESHARARYELEPYLKPFARFEEGAGKTVLEIGVGMGSDHLQWALSQPAHLSGIDLTERAVDWTSRRLALYDLPSDVRTGDAEQLPFEDNHFDVVYSWGVLHHSPDTPKAINEVWRVLKPGGTARIMIYHTWSLTGLMLWARYALLGGKPFLSMREIYDRYLESPGTKAYTVKEAQSLFQRFSHVSVKIQLCHGDLLQGSVGQRHGGPLLKLAKALWPRPLIKALCAKLGLFLLIEAKKPV